MVRGLGGLVVADGAPMALARRWSQVLGVPVDHDSDPVLRLPDGATMLTFHDITDTENVERALRERNEALEAADQMKVDFVHHVSNELRSPLTNIIGYAELLGSESVGPLNKKQREYSGHVLKSSAALLAIINDILDLASVDIGALELSIDAVDIRIDQSYIAPLMAFFRVREKRW